MGLVRLYFSAILHFAPQIANVFDKYNRINTSEDQLKIIERQRPITQQ